MAILANTYVSYTSKRNREEFSDAIYDTTPEETPLLTLIGRKSVESVHPEWSNDALRTPVATNQVVEGDEFTFSAIIPTTRLGNYCEIARSEWIISRTQEKTLKAGDRSELGRRRARAALELKTDMEISCLFNKASVAGASGTARVSGGLPSWLISNDSRGGSGTDGGFSVGTGLTVAAGNGTQRALSKAIMDAVILATFNSGGNPKVFMLSPYAKTVFSTLMQSANTPTLYAQVRGNEQATIYAGADTYRSDFGVIDVMPNRQMARHGATTARNGFLLDPEMLTLGVFDDVQEIKVAQTGDAQKRVLLVEFCLLMNNEKAHGIAADIFGMTAAS